MSRPTYCGHDHAGHGCVALASVLVESPGRSRVACRTHQAAATKWVEAGGGRVTVTEVVQPAGAEAGRHTQEPDTLFDMPGGTR